LKFLIPFAAFVTVGHWLAVRPLLKPSQSQQVFEMVGGGTTALGAAPFRVSQPPQAAAVSLNLMLSITAAIWAIGAAMVVFRWLKTWWTIRAAAGSTKRAGDFHGGSGFEVGTHARRAD
jgi:hypothetical protein